MNGNAGSRGYLLQAIICLLGALQADDNWESLTYEPGREEEKVDIAWYYPDSRKETVQVKSSQNQIGKRQAEKWAKELEHSTDATSYELILIGPCSQGVVDLGKVGNVSVPVPKPLDAVGLIEQAAHRLDKYLEGIGKSWVSASAKELIANALVTKLQTYSAGSTPMSRQDFEQLLNEWLSSTPTFQRELVVISAEWGADWEDEKGEKRSVWNQFAPKLMSLIEDGNLRIRVHIDNFTDWPRNVEKCLKVEYIYRGTKGSKTVGEGHWLELP